MVLCRVLGLLDFFECCCLEVILCRLYILHRPRMSILNRFCLVFPVPAYEIDADGTEWY